MSSALSYPCVLRVTDSNRARHCCSVSCWQTSKLLKSSASSAVVEAIIQQSSTFVNTFEENLRSRCWSTTRWGTLAVSSLRRCCYLIISTSSVHKNFVTNQQNCNSLKRPKAAFVSSGCLRVVFVVVFDLIPEQPPLNTLEQLTTQCRALRLSVKVSSDGSQQTLKMIV
jgi:hypothetical protein